MKKLVAFMAVPVCLLSSLGFGAPSSKALTQRFYGKIIEINLSEKNMVLHNRKNNIDSTFFWNENTAFSYKKNPIPPSQLTLGQNVVVTYEKNSDQNLARRITVREYTFRKKNASKN